MAKRNREYWRDRIEALEELLAGEAEQVAAGVDDMYRRAQAEIDRLFQLCGG